MKLAGVKKGLKTGYTTGACAAAAAKAAALELMSLDLGVKSSGKIKDVEIPFPDGSRHTFKIHNSKLITHNSIAQASVIKDAGDDPDVTHGAEIMAEVRIQNTDVPSPLRGEGKGEGEIVIKGGKGVGMVTKPGLPVPVGEPAINPVPRRMIAEAVKESFELGVKSYELNLKTLEVTISVPNGEELAKKTLNSRLGILGGISILGTTGIVKPVSTEAWTATITSSMDVAKAAGIKEIVLSAGRTSEKAHMKKYNLPEESYVLMGDYLEYSLQEAKRHGFKKVSLCAQWAKMLKIAMATPQTHVRFGAIDMKKAVQFLHSAGINIPDRAFNTAREIFDYVNPKLFQKICDAAGKYAEDIAKVPVSAKLVSYTGEIIAGNE
ncbi:MAG: cobalt-precorrin-5B (C(1))-methyltransferase CbiD [Nitrospirota bacterium]